MKRVILGNQTQSSWLEKRVPGGKKEENHCNANYGRWKKPHLGRRIKKKLKWKLVILFCQRKGLWREDCFQKIIREYSSKVEHNAQQKGERTRKREVDCSPAQSREQGESQRSTGLFCLREKEGGIAKKKGGERMGYRGAESGRTRPKGERLENPQWNTWVSLKLYTQRGVGGGYLEEENCEYKFLMYFSLIKGEAGSPFSKQLDKND